MQNSEMISVHVFSSVYLFIFFFFWHHEALVSKRIDQEMPTTINVIKMIDFIKSRLRVYFQKYAMKNVFYT